MPRADEDANAELVRALSGAEAAAPERAALWQRWTAWILGYLIVAAGLWWLAHFLGLMHHFPSRSRPP